MQSTAAKWTLPLAIFLGGMLPFLKDNLLPLLPTNVSMAVGALLTGGVAWVHWVITSPGDAKKLDSLRPPPNR